MPVNFRFTANDPCRARCVLLYKDHYHCNMKNCHVLFRTKERVREHGRYDDRASTCVGSAQSADTLLVDWASTSVGLAHSAETPLVDRASTSVELAQSANAPTAIFGLFALLRKQFNRNSVFWYKYFAFIHMNLLKTKYFFVNCHSSHQSQFSIIRHSRYPPSKPSGRISVIQSLSIYCLVRLSATLDYPPIESWLYFLRKKTKITPKNEGTF